MYSAPRLTSRPTNILFLVWCFDFVATTTWPTPSRYSTGCVFRNGLTLNWHSWHTEYCTVWRRRTWINSFRYQIYQVAAACGRRLHFSCSFRYTVWQLSAVARFLLQHPSSGIHCLSSLQSSPSLFTFWQRLKTLSLSAVIPRYRQLTSLHYPTVDFEVALCHFSHVGNTDWLGLTENAGHEIDGPMCRAWNCRTWKWRTKYVWHKSAQPENAGHENAGQNSVRPTLHYYEVCSCLLLLFS